ncbi:unnamed protein product [Dicrocoelium dendriticum]|nr:unnamed protein product [Dicrocoelium dendriticum]
MRDAFTKDNYPLVQDTLFLSPFPDVDYPRQPSYPSTHPMESIRVPINTETSASSYHRRGREVDTSSWDDDAAVRLRTTANPAANYCDFISFCRSSPTVRKLINRKYFLDGTRFYHQPFGIIWFVRDPCGIVCLFITWFLILYAEFVISGVILVQAPSPIFCWFTGSLYHLFTVLSVVSHFMAFATDPVAQRLMIHFCLVGILFVRLVAFSPTVLYASAYTETI